MKASLIAVLAAALGACASYQWVKPDAAADQVAQDEKTCDFEAEKAVAAGTMKVEDRVWRKLDVKYACMEAKGYKSTRR